MKGIFENVADSNGKGRGTARSVDLTCPVIPERVDGATTWGKYCQAGLFDILVHESSMEIGTNRIIDKILFLFRFLKKHFYNGPLNPDVPPDLSCTIFENNIIIPSSFNTGILFLVILQKWIATEIFKNKIKFEKNKKYLKIFSVLIRSSSSCFFTSSIFRSSSRSAFI